MTRTTFTTHSILVRRGPLGGDSSVSSKPTKFAQPRLSRVKGRSSPARGCKFGFVTICPVTTLVWDDTGHIGTNTPKFVPSRWGWPPFDPTQTGLCRFGWVWSSLSEVKKISEVNTPKLSSRWAASLILQWSELALICAPCVHLGSRGTSRNAGQRW